jgi:hypothetical protein
MQYLLIALLFLPLLLHGYALVKRKPELDQAFVDGQQLSQVKDERPLDNPPVVVKVDHCTRFSSSPTSRQRVNSFSNPDDAVQQFAAGPAASLEPDFSTTNVMLEPQKRDASAVLDGCAVYCLDDPE